MGPPKPTSEASGKNALDDVNVAPAGGQTSVTADPANLEADGALLVGLEKPGCAKGNTANRRVANILL